MAHTYTNLLTHIIFSTKDRTPLIDAELKPKLFSYMGGIIREMRGTALIINGITDHLHLLVGLPPTISMSEAMRVLKTNSSKWVHEMSKMRQTFGWQSGYGAFSVSQSNALAVSEYIAHQEEHHRRVSFQEEFVSFLKKHGIEYDERFIWQ
ncbi:MAG TPA: IS200/IS605 family transposase [Pyrinomonadaceae bacterium]